MFDKYQDKTREKLHPRILQTVRLTQFLAAIVSIVLYIVYVVRQATTSTGNEAVLGILAGAIVFTLIAIGKACYAKRKVAALVLLFLIVDVLFVAAYIAVTTLTRGAASGSSCRTNDEDDDDDDDSDRSATSTDCNLEKGVFAISIINMLVFT
ncbi:MAG: hypothetical protein LQ343_007900 [Gyalolechia ehrenbergii]|nr:MAG: hypothetical protein LQ343_007900 [Gyalolechia ehrenbergii]